MIKTKEITYLQGKWQANLEEELFELNIPYSEMSSDYGTDIVIDFADALQNINHYLSTGRKLSEFGKSLMNICLDNQPKFSQIIFAAP